MCFVERLDGLFPNTSQIAFAVGPSGPGQSFAPVAQMLGTRLYFVPAPVSQTSCDQLILVDTDERLSLQTPLDSTTDSLEAVRALRTEMEVLAEAMAAFVAAERLVGVSAESVQSIYLAAVTDAHLRLADALDAIAIDTSFSELVGVPEVIDGLVLDNQTRMDAFLSLSFSF